MTTTHPTPYTVYILKCKDQTLYTGITVDIDKRIKTHNAGKGAKYTKARLPVVVLYTEHAIDKSTALKREAAIKKMTRKKKWLLINAIPK